MGNLGYLLTKTQPKWIHLFLARSRKRIPSRFTFLSQSKYLDLWSQKIFEVRKSKITCIILILVSTIAVFWDIFQVEFDVFQIFVVVLNYLNKILLSYKRRLDYLVYVRQNIPFKLLQKLLIFLQKILVFLQFLHNRLKVYSEVDLRFGVWLLNLASDFFIILVKLDSFFLKLLLD